MENQEGFERLVPYRTEKELKEATKWYNTVDCKNIIDRDMRCITAHYRLQWEVWRP